MLENYKKDTLKMIFSSLRTNDIKDVLFILTEILSKNDDVNSKRVISILRHSIKKL